MPRHSKSKIERDRARLLCQTGAVGPVCSTSNSCTLSLDDFVGRNKHLVGSKTLERPTKHLFAYGNFDILRDCRQLRNFS